MNQISVPLCLLVQFQALLERGAPELGLRSPVKLLFGRLEEGHELADETSEVSSEQQELSEETAGSLENVSDTRFSGGAADAASEAHDTGEQFEEVNDQVQDSVENTDEEYEKFLSEVQG